LSNKHHGFVASEPPVLTSIRIYQNYFYLQSQPNHCNFESDFLGNFAPPIVACCELVTQGKLPIARILPFKVFPVDNQSNCQKYPGFISIIYSGIICCFRQIYFNKLGGIYTACLFIDKKMCSSLNKVTQYACWFQYDIRSYAKLYQLLA